MTKRQGKSGRIDVKAVIGHRTAGDGLRSYRIERFDGLRAADQRVVEGGRASDYGLRGNAWPSIPIEDSPRCRSTVGAMSISEERRP